MPRPPRILVLRGGAIGDFVVTVPALRALRERWPAAYLELVAYPRIAPLARCGGLVDRVTSLDQAQIARFFGQNPKFPEEQVVFIRSFDFIVLYLNDPDELVRRNLLLAGARQVLYGSPLVADRHAVDHLLRPLEALAIYAAGEAPAIPVPDEWRRRGVGLLRQADAPDAPVLLHPGSGSPKKNWAVDRFVEVGRALRPVYTVGEADAELERVLRGLGCSVLKPATLEDLACVLSCARAYVGNDSGVTHLAAALGVPSVAIFGPTRSALWGPRGTKVRIVEAPDGDLARLEASVVAAAVLDILSD